MSSSSDRLQLDITCPQCGQKIKKSLTWAEIHKPFVCGSCGTELGFSKEAQSEIKTGVADAAAAFNKKLK